MPVDFYSPCREARAEALLARRRSWVLTARGIFHQIYQDDQAFGLFCSIAMNGESQGGWENGRISALVTDRRLAPRVARHGADEDKHGRIFKGLMRNRGLEPVEVPPDTDYTMLLERRRIGLTHARLAREEQLTEHDITVYLAHSRVTEQRASEQMRLLKRIFRDDPQVGRAVRMISDDEDLHLASEGDRAHIDRLLRRTALAEIQVYRDVSLAVMAHMGRVLGWSKARSAVLAAGIHAVYLAERLGGWRRMTTLRQ